MSTESLQLVITKIILHAICKISMSKQNGINTNILRSQCFRQVKQHKCHIIRRNNNNGLLLKTIVEIDTFQRSYVHGLSTYIVFCFDKIVVHHVYGKHIV